MDIKLDNIPANGVPISMGGQAFKVAKPGAEPPQFEYAEDTVAEWRSAAESPRVSMNVVSVWDNSKEAHHVMGKLPPKRNYAYVKEVNGDYIKLDKGLFNTDRDGVMDGGSYRATRWDGDKTVSTVDTGVIQKWINNHVTYYDLFPDFPNAKLGVPVSDGVIKIGWAYWNKRGTRVWPVLTCITDSGVSPKAYDTSMFFDIPETAGGSADTGAMNPNLQAPPGGTGEDPAIAAPTITSVVDQGDHVEVHFTGGEPGSIVRCGHAWYDPAVTTPGIAGAFYAESGHNIQEGDLLYVLKEQGYETTPDGHPRYPNSNNTGSVFGRYGTTGLPSFTGEAVFDDSDPNFLKVTFPNGGFRQKEIVAFGPSSGVWYYPMTGPETFQARLRASLTGTGRVYITTHYGKLKLNGDQSSYEFPLTSTMQDHDFTIDVTGAQDETAVYMKVHFEMDPGDVLEWAFLDIDMDKSLDDPMDIKPAIVSDMIDFAPGSIRDHRYAKERGKLQTAKEMLSSRGRGHYWSAVYHLCKAIQDVVKQTIPSYICVPWVQLSHDMEPEELRGYLEHFYAPYDPGAGDTPASKPYAYLRYAGGRQEPWATEFQNQIILGVPGNEVWNTMGAFPTIDQHPTLGFDRSRMSVMIANGMIDEMMLSPYITQQMIDDGTVVMEMGGRTMWAGGTYALQKAFRDYSRYKCMFTDNCYGPGGWETSSGTSFTIPTAASAFGILGSIKNNFEDTGIIVQQYLPNGSTYGIYEANNTVNNLSGGGEDSKLQEDWWTGMASQSALMGKVAEIAATGGQHISYFCLNDNLRWATRSPVGRGNGLHMSVAGMGILNNQPEFGMSKPTMRKDEGRVIAHCIRGGGCMSINTRIPGQGADTQNTTIESCRSSVRWLLPSSITSGTLYKPQGDWSTHTSDNPGALDFVGESIAVLNGNLVFELDPAQVAIFVPD